MMASPTRDRLLSRRRAVALLAGAGATLLAAACGQSATPPPRATPAVPAPPPTVATPAVPTTAGLASSPAATAGTPAATPGPRGGAPLPPTAHPDFARLLALVPRVPGLVGQRGIQLADYARQKRNYGLTDVTSWEAARGLPEERRVLLRTLQGLPQPFESGSGYDSEWRAATGYDFWQLDRAVQAGVRPEVWTRLEGGFDLLAIEAALERAGHQPVPYREATVLALGEDDNSVDYDQEFGQLTLGTLNRVVLQTDALAATGQMELAEAGIDAAAGRRSTFATDPDHAALLAALGPVVGALLTRPEALYVREYVAASPPAGHLPPYHRVGLGLRDDGREHAMVIALLYDDADAARQAGPVLRQRLLAHQLSTQRRPLRELAEPGEPELAAAAGRAVLVTPLAIRDIEHLGLWGLMVESRDYPFLAA